MFLTTICHVSQAELTQKVQFIFIYKTNFKNVICGAALDIFAFSNQNNLV